MRKREQRNHFQNSRCVSGSSLEGCVHFRGVHRVLITRVQLFSYKAEVRSPCECCDWRSGADLQPEIRIFLSFWEKSDDWDG